jgi:hypothetical protein
MIFSTSVIALWEVNRGMDVRRSLTRLGSNAVVRKLAPVEERAVAISVETTCRPGEACPMIRKLQSGEYRLYSRKINPKTGKRRNLGTFKSRAAAEKHERDVQYFKRH